LWPFRRPSDGSAALVRQANTMKAPNIGIFVAMPP
jgi:hypothetical protein